MLELKQTLPYTTIGVVYLAAVVMNGLFMCLSTMEVQCSSLHGPGSARAQFDADFLPHRRQRSIHLLHHNLNVQYICVSVPSLEN